MSVDLSWQMQPEVRSWSAYVQILVVDADPAIRRYLRTALRQRGYRVHDVDDSRLVISALQRYRPRVLILDPQSIGSTGISIITGIRKEWTHLPILVISEQVDPSTIADVLDAGADDYVVKPFSIEELSARVRAALRHAGPSNALFSAGDLSVDLIRGIVRKKGEFVRLTPIEFDLLKGLIAFAGSAVTPRQLSSVVWGDETPRRVRSLRVHMTNLRNKLETDPAHPELIVTNPRFGYRLRILD